MDTMPTVVEALKNPLKFNDSIASLQHLTCSKITQIILNNFLARTDTFKTSIRSNTNYFSSSILSSASYLSWMLGDYYQHECYNFVNDLNLPQSLRDEIRRCVAQSWTEIEKWVTYMVSNIFSYYSPVHCMDRLNLNCLAWFQNGYVDYKQTAKNIILGPDFNAVGKFIIMSKFCFIDDLEKSSLSILPANFVNKVWPADQFLVHYWLLYLKNQLNLIPLANPNVSMDYTMAEKCNQYHWFAFEYFWNQLGIREKILIWKNKLADYNENMDQYYGELLSNMTYYNQRLLLSEIFVDVMHSFWFRSSQPRLALKTWTGVRDLCTVDQFRALVQRLLPNLITYENCTALAIEPENYTELFYEIWTTTPIRIKNEYVIKYADEFIKFFPAKKHATGCFKLIRNFLSLKDENSRKEVLRNLVKDIIPLFGNCPLIIDAIQFCFPDTREQIEFKNLALNSVDAQKYLVNLAKTDLETFSSILKFYSPYSMVTQKHLENILMSNEIDRSRFVYQFNEWFKLSQCIDQLLPSSSTNFKIQFILSTLNDNRLSVPEIWDHADEIAKIIENVFPVAPDEGSDLKQAWLGIFRTNFLADFKYWENFDEQKFRKFVSWCLGCAQNDARVDEFQKIILSSVVARNYLIRLLNEGNLENFTNILKVFSSDAIFAEKYLEWILMANEIDGSRFLYQFEEWLRLSQFIDQLLPISSSPEFKVKFLSSTLNDNRPSVPLIWDHADEIIKIVENVFLVAPKKVPDLKLTWLDFFRNNILVDFQYWENFDEQKFQKFVSWCLECAQNDVRVGEFLKTILDSVDAQKYLALLLRNDKFENFTNILKVFSSDPIVSEKYLEQILKSNEIDRSRFLYEFDVWLKLSQCIDHLLPESSSTTFKMQFFSSTLNDTSLSLPLIWDHTDKIAKIVKNVFSVAPEKVLDSKQKWLGILRTNIMADFKYWENYDEQKYRIFISWCWGCSQDDVRVDEFLKTILDSVDARRHLIRLLNNEKFESFINILKIFSSDALITENYLEQIMISNEIDKSCFLYQFEKWLKLSQCIHQLLPELSCTTLKIQFLVSSLTDANTLRVPQMWYYPDEVSKIVEDVFRTDPEKASNLKRTWLDLFRVNVSTDFQYWNNFDEKKFHRFVSWCLECSQSTPRVDEFSKIILDEFKKTILDEVNVQMHLVRLLNEKNFNSFINVLRVYSSDAIITEKYLEQILISNSIDRSSFLDQFDEWLKLSQCIDQLLPSSSSTILKIQFLESSLNNDFSSVPQVWHYTDEVAKIVENVFLVAPEKVSDLKQTWLDFFRTNVLTNVQYWMSFDEQKFQKFVSWCLGCDQNDVSVIEFKKAILIEDVSLMILTNIYKLENLKNENIQIEGIDCLYRCLKWYFTDVEERKKCVIGLMHELDDASVSESFQLSNYVDLAVFFEFIFED